MGFSLESRSSVRSYSEKLGYALQLMRSGGRSNLSIEALYAWVWPAIKLNQIEFIFANHSGLPVGYVIWAYLSDDVVAEMETGSDRLLDISEWNEGDNLWIMDIVAIGGALKPLLILAFENRFRQFTRIRGFKTSNSSGNIRLIDLKISPETKRYSLSKYI